MSTHIKTVKAITLYENHDQGTAGLAYASQLVETTSAYSIEFGTVPHAVIVGGSIKKTKELPKEETRPEIIRRIARRHKEALDLLDDA